MPFGNYWKFKDFKEINEQKKGTVKRNSQYRPKKGIDEYFYVPVLDRLVSISTGLVPEPALCPGAGAAERSQETM